MSSSLKWYSPLMISHTFGWRQNITSTHIMPAKEVDSYAFHRAKKLAEKSPQALRETKRLLKAHNADLLRQVMDEEIVAFSRLMGGAHAREAMTAFFEKRKPIFE